MLLGIFNEIISMSFMAAIAVISILIIKMLTKDKLGFKFQYIIWFILILRLLPIFNLYSKMSIYNYVPTYESTIMNMGDTNVVLQSEKVFFMDKYVFIEICKMLSVIWIVGALAIFITVFLVNRNINKKIKLANIIEDENIIEVFNECKRKVNVEKNIDLIVTNVVKSPCVYGVIKPKILIPNIVLENKDKIEFKYIFLHELMHIKKHHLVVNYIIYIISTIHWFNPLIRYGLNKMKDERESDCDLNVLSILDENENKSYGKSLLDLMEISSRAPWLPQMAGIINKRSKIERRIIMIKNFKKNSYKLTAMGVAVLAIAGTSLLTGAKAADVNSTKDNKNEAVVTVENYDSKRVKEDNINLPFEDDKEVVGKWEAVDFVKTPDEFKVGEKQFKDDLYMKYLIVLPDGKMAQPATDRTGSDEKTPVKWLNWTKGYIMHSGDKTASEYIIKEFNGEKYMFEQWKSGDYTLRGMTPYYYVYKFVK